MGTRLQLVLVSPQRTGTRLQLVRVLPQRMGARGQREGAPLLALPARPEGKPQRTLEGRIAQRREERQARSARVERSRSSWAPSPLCVLCVLCGFPVWPFSLFELAPQASHAESMWVDSSAASHLRKRLGASGSSRPATLKVDWPAMA